MHAGHSVIYAGVNIGDYVVVLPMSVITKDVPNNCIVAGAPAKVIRKLTEEDINKMVQERMREINEKQKSQ